MEWIKIVEGDETTVPSTPIPVNAFINADGINITIPRTVFYSSGNWYDWATGNKWAIDYIKGWQPLPPPPPKE